MLDIVASSTGSQGHEFIAHDGIGSGWNRDKILDVSKFKDLFVYIQNRGDAPISAGFRMRFYSEKSGRPEGSGNVVPAMKTIQLPELPAGATYIASSNDIPEFKFPFLGMTISYWGTQTSEVRAIILGGL